MRDQTFKTGDVVMLPDGAKAVVLRVTRSRRVVTADVAADIGFPTGIRWHFHHEVRLHKPVPNLNTQESNPRPQEPTVHPLLYDHTARQHATALTQLGRKAAHLRAEEAPVPAELEAQIAATVTLLEVALELPGLRATRDRDAKLLELSKKHDHHVQGASTAWAISQGHVDDAEWIVRLSRDGFDVVDRDTLAAHLLDVVLQGHELKTATAADAEVWWPVHKRVGEVMVAFVDDERAHTLVVDEDGAIVDFITLPEAGPLAGVET